MSWKNRTAIILGALLALVFTSCSIEEAPVVPPMPVGDLYVSATDTSGNSLPGGSIYLDGFLQPGKTTPDTIEAPVGDHWLRIELTGFVPDSEQCTIVQDSVTTAILVLVPLGVGDIIASAVDSSNGAALLEGYIFLNGTLTEFTTPDTISDIPVGRYAVGVALPGYDFRQDSVDVMAASAQIANLALPAVPWHGIIHIAATVENAQICMDDRLLPEPAPWIVHGVPGGAHTYSCYREGYATQPPALVNANLYTYGYQELAFDLQLWSNGLGYQEGKLAPAFDLESDIGDTVALGGYRGRVILVSFWFRDCPPCMQEMPYIQQVYSELGGQGFRVLAINPMFNDNLQDLIEVRANLGLTFEMIMDQPGFITTLAYGANQFPTNCLVDQRGVVDWYTGSLDYAELRARVEQLLNQ